MSIPTEVVGSLPRPIYLQKAYTDYDSGKISKDDLVKLQDKAVADSLSRMQETGETFISDGEQRVSSFATYPFLDTLGGTGLAENLGGGGQHVAFFDDGHNRQFPKLVRGPFRYKTYAWQNLQQSISQGGGYPMKQAVISPSMLSLLYPLNESVEGYSRDQFNEDLINECEKDIRGCFQAGAKRVSIDFTEGRLALKNDDCNPWTGAGLLETFIELNNKVLDRFTPAERTNIGVHTCAGGDFDSPHSCEVPYHSLLPSLFKINAGYFLIQLASEPAETRASIYQEIGKHIRQDANGVKQVAFIGVVNTISPVVETPEQIAEALTEAGRYIPVDQLGATDDCGFSPFSNDVKPKYGGNPDFARDIAFQKIAARVKGVKIASVNIFGQNN